MIMSKHTPPIVLVTTWLQLINLSAEEDARKHAKRMIKINFGSVDLAIVYIQQNQPKKIG
jgi:hypothetical protein